MEPSFQGIGRLLVGIGVLLVVVGAAFLLLSRLGLSRLPGDIVVHKGNWTLYAPLGLMLLLSLLLTLVINLLGRR